MYYCTTELFLIAFTQSCECILWDDGYQLGVHVYGYACVFCVGGAD